jgi:hypothetical protein
MATIIIWTERRLRRAVEDEAARRGITVSDVAEQYVRAGLKTGRKQNADSAAEPASAVVVAGGGARRVRDQQPT